VTHEPPGHGGGVRDTGKGFDRDQNYHAVNGPGVADSGCPPTAGNPTYKKNS